MSDDDEREITWVDWLLGAGIVFFPLIFYWFLFRSKYTMKERIIGGIYTGFMFIVWVVNATASPSHIVPVERKTERPPQVIEEIRPALTPTPTPTIVIQPMPVAPDVSPQGQQSSYEQDQRQAAAGGPAMQVESVDLAQAFQNNEVAAKMQYGGRTLYVDGTVVGITLDFMDNPVIQLEGLNSFNRVHASFDKSYSSGISQVQKGQRIRVVCRKVDEVIGSPMLGNCSF